MSDEQICVLLRRLNAGEARDIIIRPIGTDVWWGVVWGESPSALISNGVLDRGFEFFFVRAGNGKFAGAVHRMGSDEMHSYVVEEYRGKGLLVEPLKTIILPYIFWKHRSRTQRGTTDPNRPFGLNSARLALRVGFRKSSESADGVVYEITRDDVPEYKPTSAPTGTERELEQLKIQVECGNMIAVVQVDASLTALVQSSFDRDGEGWGLIGDGTTPVFQDSGGNPGGFVSADSQLPGSYWYWLAPQKYSGNQSAAYGGVLQFEPNNPKPVSRSRTNRTYS